MADLMRQEMLVSDPDEMFDVVERAEAGDESALPALRQMVQHIPEIRKMVGANIEQVVESSICSSMVGEDNLAFPEGIRHRIAVMRRELEGPNPSPIERLLIDRVVATWLQIQQADIRCAQTKASDTKRANFYRKRQESAHRRHLSSIKSLAQVRKMGLPALQVNIGLNQTNVVQAEVNAMNQ